VIPFRQLPFERLPAEPRRAHPYFRLRSRDVEVGSAPFGKIRVHVREAGEGPPLLLVHGLMTSGYSFRYVVEPLAAHFRCIVPDLPGAGRTDKPTARYRADDLATFLAELIEAEGIAGCDVIGNSLGGYVTMRLAMMRPDLVSRLISIHCPGVPLARLYALKWAMSVPGSERLLDWLVSRHPERWAHRNVHYWDETLKSVEESREYGAPLATTQGRRAFARYLSDALDPADMKAFVADLARGPFPVPLMLLFVRRDPMVPPSVGRRLAEIVPSAELVWLDDASHFAHVDAPEAVVATVLPFLSRPGVASAERGG
jgi:pimeloyl-ACP methyl ester carboxylesterase